MTTTTQPTSLNEKTSDMPFDADGHQRNLISHAVSVLLAEGYEYVSTGLSGSHDCGLVDDYDVVGRYVEVDPNSPWCGLRLTVSEDCRSIYVDEETSEDVQAVTDLELAVTGQYCAALNDVQDFFRVSSRGNGMVVSSALHPRGVVSEQDVGDLLRWSSIATHHVWVSAAAVLYGERTPAEAAGDALAFFAGRIRPLLDRLQLTGVPRSPLASDNIHGGAS